ncbi:MAG TPA: hypothetical protein VE287_06470 [Actinopolymorphaceae bacterium]|nr:hypothetical protein [Actinopolymorphaceae bacterium]
MAADHTSTDVASAVLVAAGILLIIVVRVGWRLIRGRVRWLTLTVSIVFFICAFAFILGAGR